MNKKEILKLIENRINILKRRIKEIPNEDIDNKEGWNVNLCIRKAEAELLRDMIKKNKIEGHF